jgi:ribosomal protein L12E/L44/L45/RPP1/RPP2
VSFSGFGFDCSGMAGASASHPPPFESTPLAHTHDEEEEEEEEEEEGEEEDDDE